MRMKNKHEGPKRPPIDIKLPLKHIRQREDHTCGLCSSRVVYRYYGIPDKHLRKGIKVDESAVPYTNLEGTLPWDMLKQFREDGFIADVLAPNNSAFRKVINRLKKGHPAIICLGVKHWVVIGGYDAKQKQFLSVDSSCCGNSGWRGMTKDEASNDILLIVSIRGNDGIERESSVWGLLWEVSCIVPDLFKKGGLFAKKIGDWFQ